MKKLLLGQFNFHHRLYNNVLDGFTDEETNQRLHGNESMSHVKYLAGFMTLLNHHQAYHIGQIGILRRGFGKEPMEY